MKKKNKGVLLLLVVIILVFGVICFILASNIIQLSNDNKETGDTNDNIVNDTQSGNNTENDKVDIDLSISNVTVSNDGANAKIHIDGTINLSYDNSKYAGVTLSGYCLGADNEKYLINGPGDGRALFHNDDNNNLMLTENVTKNIECSDGTFKMWSEIDWENVNIKYCKIDKMTAILNEGTDNPEIVLNVEKSFN